jgi:hypothetical protein
MPYPSPGGPYSGLANEPELIELQFRPPGQRRYDREALRLGEQRACPAPFHNRYLADWRALLTMRLSWAHRQVSKIAATCERFYLMWPSSVPPMVVV